MISSAKNIKLFATCISVKGVNRAIICDLQRNTYVFIPDDLHDILLLHDGKKIFDINKYYNNQYDEILDEYFEFLLKNELFYFKY